MMITHSYRVCQQQKKKGVEPKVNIEISRDKVNIAMARKQMTVSGLAKAYGVTRARMNVILNQRTVSTVAAGRLASALGVDVTEILES